MFEVQDQTREKRKVEWMENNLESYLHDINFTYPIN